MKAVQVYYHYGAIVQIVIVLTIINLVYDSTFLILIILFNFQSVEFDREVRVLFLDEGLKNYFDKGVLSNLKEEVFNLLDCQQNFNKYITENGDTDGYQIYNLRGVAVNYSRWPIFAVLQLQSKV